MYKERLASDLPIRDELSLHLLASTTCMHISVFFHFSVWSTRAFDGTRGCVLKFAIMPNDRWVVCDELTEPVFDKALLLDDKSDSGDEVAGDAYNKVVEEAVAVACERGTVSCADKNENAEGAGDVQSCIDDNSASVDDDNESYDDSGYAYYDGQDDSVSHISDDNVGDAYEDIQDEGGSSSTDVHDALDEESVCVADDGSDVDVSDSDYVELDGMLRRESTDISDSESVATSTSTLSFFSPVSSVFNVGDATPNDWDNDPTMSESSASPDGSDVEGPVASLSGVMTDLLAVVQSLEQAMPPVSESASPETSVVSNSVDVSKCAMPATVDDHCTPHPQRACVTKRNKACDMPTKSSHVKQKRCG